ncbi:MAG: hypothetical protein LBT00_14555 [Spirochaetaceae bacterium]|nr:hypothetical protein [Spirochaetaceae bacterium]
MTGNVVIARREAAKQSRRRRPSHWVASLGNVPLARNDGERCHCAARSLPVIFHYPCIIFNSREARITRPEIRENPPPSGTIRGQKCIPPAQ